MSTAQHNALVEFRLAKQEMAEIDAGRYLSGTSPTAQAREREVVEARMSAATKECMRHGRSFLMVVMGRTGFPHPFFPQSPRGQTCECGYGVDAAVHRDDPRISGAGGEQ